MEQRFAKKLQELNCPYNSDHVFTKDKLGAHLAKCRRNYRLRMNAEGRTVSMLTCKYSVKHLIPAPELLTHEARCPKQKMVRVYLRQDGPPGLPLSEDDFNDLYGGLQIGVVIGSENYGRPMSIQDLRYPVTALLRAKAAAATLEKADEEANSSSASKTAQRVETFQAQTGLGTLHEDEDILDEDEYSDDECCDDGALGGITRPEDDESYWESSGPDFQIHNYKTSLSKPSKPILKFPMGRLSKVQRRKFVEWNSEWVKSSKDQAAAEKGPKENSDRE